MSQLFKNNAKSRLTAAIGTGAGITLDVTSGTGVLFPAASVGVDFFLATLEDSSGNKEIVKVSNRAGDTMTISERGLDGTTARGFSAGDLFELRLTAGFIDALKKGSIVFVIDGGGSAIVAPEVKGFIEAPFSGTIVGCKLFGDLSGDINIRIYKSSYANYPWTDGVDDAEEITDSAGGHEPKIVAAFKSVADLSGWTLDFTQGDIFVFKVMSAATLTKCTISMMVERY